MQPKRINKNQMMTGRVRLSYPCLLTPSESPLSKGKYMTSFIIDAADTATLQMVQQLIDDAVEEAKQGVWKGKKGQLDVSRWKELDAEYQVDGDKWTVRCSGGKYPIPVIDAFKNEVRDPLNVYGGAYARVMLRAFPWVQPGRMGVSLQCQAVQLLGGGTPYGGNGTDLQHFDVEDAVPTQNISQQTNTLLYDDMPF